MDNESYKFSSFSTSGVDLMMHPELQIDAHSLEPLLKPLILNDLKKT